MVTTPYCEISGLDCNDVVQAVDPKHGSRSIDKIKMPGKRYGRLADQGQSPSAWEVTARFWDEVDMDEWLATINDIEPSIQAYLFRSDRFMLIDYADAHKDTHQIASDPAGTGPMNFYRAKATLYSPAPWEFGADQGIAYTNGVISLPQSSSLLTNAGRIDAGLGYLHASGYYLPGTGYTEDLTLYFMAGDGATILDQVELCDKLMQADAFRVSRWGEVEHYYTSNLGRTWADICLDLHSLASGGSISGGILTLDEEEYFYMPFYGSGYPLPATDDCYLELWVTALSGTVSAYVAFETDLSDAVAIDYTLRVGYNKIYIPDAQGADFIGIGLVAAAGGSVSVSKFKGTVNRYMPYSIMYKTTPGDSFILKLDAGGNEKLSKIELRYNDVFWS